MLGVYAQFQAILERSQRRFESEGGISSVEARRRPRLSGLESREANDVHS
jgi:hypothetical protein